MLTVIRIRMVDSGEFDRYGKPIYTEQSTSHTATAFAPLVAGDVMGVDTVVSSDGGTLYFRVPNATDALPGDQFIVRGTTYDCEGRDALWESADGVMKGNVVVLKRTVLTDG